MIPWFSFTTIQLGPVIIQVWGLFVALGIILAVWLAAKRAKAQGLDPKAIWDMAFWVVLWGIIGARLFHVALYDPAHYIAAPLEIIDLRQPGYAILGGFLGGAAAFFVMARRRGLDFLAYADTVAWGIPWGCGVGRIGCFFIHDHPGTLTSFIGGVQFPDGQVRHDLGLYLSILGFFMGVLFVLIGRTKQKTGTYLGLFLFIYGIARFLLDFLRIIDHRIVGLTPTQWTMFLFVVLGISLLMPRAIVAVVPFFGRRR
ncbi:MAG: hypothetical protein RL141_297 [Candidatus Parcubacteria bacterium]|jgi:phosphatidylglycerol:prolipoprotein diacylglycerol transferase